MDIDHIIKTLEQLVTELKAPPQPPQKPRIGEAVIQNGHPVPKVDHKNQRKYFIDDLKVGENLYLEDPRASAILSSAMGNRNRDERRFCVRAVKTESGVPAARLVRLADRT